MYTKLIEREVTDEDGKVTIEEVVVEMPEEEYNEIVASLPSPETEARTQRNARLSECDWSQGEDVPDFIKLPYREYRQALRDITSHVNWPDLTRDDWPTKP